MNVIGALCKVQSLRNKHLQVSDLIIDYSLNFIVFTETRLSNTEDNENCLNSTDLNRDDLKILTYNHNKRGGSLVLITKYQSKTKVIHLLNMPHGQSMQKSMHHAELFKDLKQ